MKQFRFLLAASVASLASTGALVAPAAAQQITSSVQGRVADDAGAPITGAKVVVTDTRTQARTTLTTGADGRFSATGLISGGPYTVTATAPGYEGQSVRDITITLQGATTLAFALNKASDDNTGTIVVTAARAGVSQLAVGPGQSFGAQVVENAPSFSRDVRDVIRIDPRLTLDRNDSSGQDQISCLGGNDRGNVFTVDGISQSDIYGLNGNGFASRSSTPIPYDAIRETSVQFAPFDVEYGQFTGCAINVITKSGSNALHGDAFFEYSDNGLRGKNVADKSTSPVQAEKHWGASLGGPIIKDRLFFFGAYSHQETGYAFDYGPVGSGLPTEYDAVSLADFNTVSDILKSVYGIDTGGVVRNLPFKNDRYFGRLDAQITEDQRLELTYQHLDESTMKRGGFYPSFSSPTVTGADNFYNSGTKSDYYSARLYSNWTDNFSTEIRYAHSKVKDIQDPIGGGEAQDGNPIPRIIVGVDDGNGNYGTIQAGPDQYRTANDLKTWVDQATFIAKLSAGDHQFKFGANLNQVKIFNLFVPNATGTLIFSSIADLQNGILSNGTSFKTYSPHVNNGETIGAYGNYSATGDVTDAAADFKRTVYSAFLQDDWQINDRLSATGGLRVDWYDGSAPGYNPNFAARYNGRSNAVGFSALPPIVMPRAAVTYDAGDFAVFSRVKLRAGAGIFSGGDPLVWFGNTFQGNGFAYNEGSLLSDGCPTGPVSVVNNGSFTGVPSCLSAAGSSSAALGMGNVQSIDPNIKTPSVLRFNADWQSNLDVADSGFFSGWRMNLDFIYSHYQNPFTTVDLSQIPDIREGLNGYAIDGRPIYAAIDSTVDGCTAQFVSANPVPTFSNVNDACYNTSRNSEYMLTNGRSYNSWTASFILSKRFNRGVFTSGGSVDFTLGYAYTDAKARAAMTSSTASSNYGKVAAFDRQDLAESQSLYASKHNFTLHTTFTETFVEDLKTRLGITFTARSGKPFSLTFKGSGTFNNSRSGSDNALLYVPSGATDPNISPDSTITEAQINALDTFLKSTGCGYTPGQTIARNTCENNWYYDMDLTLSQELPGPGHFFGKNDKIKLFATVDNFLNLIDKNWNVLRHRTYTGLEPVATTNGVDAEGRYILTGIVGNDLAGLTSTYNRNNNLNIDASVWRIKIGVSYNF